ncbi:MAG: hypothetical protein GX080_08840 [Tissierellia bacterium]|nr:hypothetical protein [Tissierellia bacterium]
MIRYKKLLTLKILDRDTREPIGKIEEIICSDDFKKVDYLVIKNGNLIKNKAIIRFDDIHFINKDQVVYIKAANDLDDKMERNISSEKEGSKLFNKEIIDENEECIGYVRDIVINKDNGKIEGFIITEGIFEDLIKGRNYLPLLDDTIIDDKAISIRSNILI